MGLRGRRHFMRAPAPRAASGGTSLDAAAFMLSAGSSDSSDPVLAGGQHRFRTDDGGAVDTFRGTASQPKRVVHCPPAKNRQPLCLRSQLALNARRIGAA